MDMDHQAATATPELLAIVEVDKKKRVRCQHKGCKHTVYKRIHIVRLAGGVISCVGQTCYKAIESQYPSLKKKRPAFGDRSSQPLSDEELAMLETNTEALLERFRLLDAKEKEAEPVTPQLDRKSDASLKEYASKATRQRFLAKGIDPDSPGFKGWAEAEAKELYEKLKKERA